MGLVFCLYIFSGSYEKTGQMETTVHESFIAFSKIKMWASRTECPLAIKESKRVYDKFYSDNAESRVADEEDPVATDEWDVIPPRTKGKGVLVEKPRLYILLTSAYIQIHVLNSPDIVTTVSCTARKNVILVTASYYSRRKIEHQRAFRLS